MRSHTHRAHPAAQQVAQGWPDQRAAGAHSPKTTASEGVPDSGPTTKRPSPPLGLLGRFRKLGMLETMNIESCAGITVPAGSAAQALEPPAPAAAVAQRPLATKTRAAAALATPRWLRP